jgi:ABC-type phosphate transport system substrate-binding protein
MKTMAKGLAALAVAVAAGAATAPEVHAQHGSLEFSYTQSQTSQTPQSATAGSGSISFTGSLTTPTPCYELSASHSVRGSRVIVTVTATGTGGFCTQVITHNNYQGTVSGLAPGDYTFQVVHRTGGGQRETVYSEPVTVQ